MRIRLTILLLTVCALAGGFAVRGLLADGERRPEQTAVRADAGTAAQIAQLEAQVGSRPDDLALLLRLGALYLARARESGDPSFYGLAERAAQRALDQAPGDPAALVLAGETALAQHRFTDALAMAERARDANPDLVAAYGVLTDALVELGRDEEAAAAAQEMIDRRPDFASYSRASYLRELHGDQRGAIELMERAAASAPSRYDAAWALVLVGNLHLAAGDLSAAERAYTRAAGTLPGDAIVLAAQARTAQAYGHAGVAEQLLRAALELRPVPEYAVALGDLLASQGRPVEAQEQYAFARAVFDLMAADGVEADLELALFEADHGDPARAYALAREAHTRRPSIYTADAVAWAAFKVGRIDEARRYMDEALRLGTRDPRLAFHSAMIAMASGDPILARRQLERAIDGGAALSPLQLDQAEQALALAARQ